MYCVKSKSKTEKVDAQSVVSKNNRPRLRGNCTVCGCTKSQFVAMPTGGDLVSTLNSITGKIKLLRAKLPGEMHIPGMNFAGPGTNLN